MCFCCLLSLRSLRCRTGVHMCQFPATPRVFRDLHSSKYPAGRPTSALKASLLAQCALKVGLGQSGAISPLTQAVSCGSRDHVRINIQSPVSGVTSEDQLEASAELHHPIRGLTWSPATPLMVLREGAETQHCLGLRVAIRQKTSQQFWVTVASISWNNWIMKNESF